MNPRSVRAALKSGVVRAMKQRDRPALVAYRTALAAIDNAEAVPLDKMPRAGAIETSAVGVGRAEAQRRELTEQEMIDIVEQEARERVVAADSLANTNPDAASRLRHEADVLVALLDSG